MRLPLPRCLVACSILGLALLLPACGDDGGGGDGSNATSSGPTTPGDSDGTGPDGDTVDPVTGDDDDSVDSTGEPLPPGETIYEEGFDGAEGSAWPAPWEEGGTRVISSEVQGGQGRWNGETTEVARMLLPGFSELDIDARITVTFEAIEQQGFGLYARQNGGALTQTNPLGQGYAVYIEGNGTQEIGIWREIDGVEELLVDAPVPGSFIVSGTPYRVRLVCQTEGGQTRLRGKVWPAGEAEPAAWSIEHLDGTPQLQGTQGAFALDVYNYAGTGSLWVDDFRVDRL